MAFITHKDFSNNWHLKILGLISLRAVGCKKTLIWGYSLDTRMQISIHCSPMLQVNCPILHDVSLAPPIDILEPSSLITPS